MTMLVLALVIGIYLRDAPPWQATPLTATSQAPWLWLAILLGAKLLLLTAYGLVCRRALRALDRGNANLALRRLDLAGAGFRTILLGLYGLDLVAGLLDFLRQSHIIGDVILLDELATMLPTLATMVAGWWLYYPVDRRLREAMFMRQLDQGLPVHPIWSRGQYLVAQFRHQIALILAPLLLIMAWSEFAGQASWMRLPDGYDLRMAATLAGAGCVFLFAPVMIRHLWDTAPLPDGELRRRLIDMCKGYRVGVRELLLWRTFGGMINAAVMGVIAPLRYILITDALLETMPPANVEAVMAHEVAHVKKHHMFWLLVLAVGLLSGLQIAWLLAMSIGAEAALQPGAAAWVGLALADELRNPDGALINMTSIVGSLATWVLLFGWVSRRFERQADTFAVQHFSRHAQRSPQLLAEAQVMAQQAGPDHASAAAPICIQPGAVQVMTDALQRVADLNHIPTRKRSWRHGSIAWRQQYLRQLVGQPIDALPIDRQVLWIKLGGAAIFVASIVAAMLLEG